MKSKMKKSGMKAIWKTEIDERQQQELHRVEAIGYWIAFYLLIIAVVVESFFMARPFREWAVEWGIFMILALYQVFRSMHIGVWSEYKQNPTTKDFLCYSLAGSAAFAVIFTIGNWLQAAPEQRDIGAFSILFAGYFGFLPCCNRLICCSGRPGLCRLSSPAAFQPQNRCVVPQFICCQPD